MKKSIFPSFVAFFTGLALVFSCGSLAASEEVEAQPPVTSRFLLDKQPLAQEWRGMIGLGVGVVPKYMGSKDSRNILLPVARLTYDRYFLGGMPGAGLGAGAYLYKEKNWDFGVGLAAGFGSGRKESDDSRLQGLGDVKATTWASVFTSYQNEGIKLGLTLASDAGRNQQGTRAQIEVEGIYRPTAKLRLTAGPKLTYGDGKYVQSLFGVTAGQSASSGLAAFTPKAGVVQSSLDFGMGYAISRDWMFGANASFGRLQGDAAQSPITQDKKVTKFIAYVGYRF